MVSSSCIWYLDREIRGFQQYAHAFGRLVAKRERKQEKYLQRKQWRQGSDDDETDNDCENTTAAPAAQLTWSRSLWNAYKAFHKVTKVQEINEIMNRPCPGVTAFCVGLERWALPGLRPARSNARKALHRAVFQLQTTAAIVGAVPHTASLQIRKACREITQPSRLFAHYTAVLSSELDDY